MDETDRIRDAYRRRDASGDKGRYSYHDPSALFIYQQRETAILRALSRFVHGDLSTKRILDLGCGAGGVLRDFLKYGARPEHCFGIDLLSDRIERARHLSPNMHFKCGNAEAMPYEDGAFDIVLCFTVFTSILDDALKQSVAREMWRVLAPAGIILWFDYHMNNPKNPDVRGVKRPEILSLFDAAQTVVLERTTLAPPLARAVVPRSPVLCHLLSKVPLLCTHYLGVIRKAGETP